MPKVVYTASKGLVQETGSGFEINDVALVEEVQALTDPSSATVNPYGTTTLALTTGTPSATLAAPTSSEPAGVKKVISCISRSGGDATVTLTGGGIQTDGSTALASLAFDAAGETAVLISNGVKWVAVAVAGATQA